MIAMHEELYNVTDNGTTHLLFVTLRSDRGKSGSLLGWSFNFQMILNFFIVDCVFMT